MSVDSLQAKIRAFKNPTALGMDIQPDLIPRSILDGAFLEFGDSPKALAEGYVAFGLEILDRLKALIPAVKFNTGYYDALGAEGFAAMQRLCAAAKSMGYYVIIETMRSDFEEVAALNAQTYFGSLKTGAAETTFFDADSLCVSAFLGSDGIKPYLPYCKEQEKSLFILAKTPNKSSREVQDLISGDRVIYTVMTDLAMRWGNNLLAQNGYSQIGVVVGATHPTVLRELRGKYDRLFFLVPGYDAQGGGAKEVQHAFDKFGHGALVCAAHSILGAWKKEDADGCDFTERAYDAAMKIKRDIAQYVTVI